MTFDYSADLPASVRFTDVDGDQLHIEPTFRHLKPAISLRTARADGQDGAAVDVLFEETEELIAGIRRTARTAAFEHPHTTPNEVRFSRRFVIQRPDEPDIHGVQFPSGHVIADHPDAGLMAATALEHLVQDASDAVVHWADAPEGRRP